MKHIFKLILFLILLLQASITFADWSDGAACGTNSSTSSASTLAKTPSGCTVNVGDVLIVVFSGNNIDTSDGNTSLCFSVTDAQSNTYVKLREFTNAQGSAAAGATTCVFASLITTQISGAVTVNLGSAITAKSLILRKFNPGAGASSITADGAADLANDGADPGALTATGSDSGQHLWIRSVACETNDGTAMTQTSGWTVSTQGVQADTGSAGTSMATRFEWKVATGTGSGSSDPTYVAADCASVNVGLLQSGGAGAPTATPTETPTVTNTPTITNTPTQTPTVTNTPTITNTPTQTPTITNTPTVTNTPTETPTVTPTPAVTNTPTATVANVSCQAECKRSTTCLRPCN